MNTVETITTYIRTQLVPGGESAIEPDSNLVEHGHLDSTAMLELVLWVGDTFGINIQAEEFTAENFGTPRLIAEFVQIRSGATAEVPLEGAGAAAG
jgi:acyl carrier protein